MRKTLIFLTLAVLLFALPASSFAKDGYQFNASASGVAGFSQKVSEKIGLFLKFTKTAKAGYLRTLLDKRLAELVWAADKNIDMVEETTSRYSTYAGHYTNFIADKDVAGEKEMAALLFDKHTEILADSQKKFEYDSAWWLSIQHDINTLRILREKI